MSKLEPQIKSFLEKHKHLLTEPSAIGDFISVVKKEQLRQVRDQLASEFTPLLTRLAAIEKDQETIIRLLKQKLNLDVRDKELQDLLEKVLNKELQS